MPFIYEDQPEVVGFPEATTRKPKTKVTYGCPFTIAAPRHVRDTLNAQRVYILASKGLSQNTSSVADLEKALGDRHVATHIGLTPHVLLRELVPIVEEIRAKQADCLVTIGGGTLTDAAKILTIAMSLNLNTYEEILSAHQSEHPKDRKKRTGGFNLLENPLPRIHIPTTLSGGEYSNASGGCDDSGEKLMFHARNLFADLVVLDPKLSVSTPLDVWIQSGFRTLDHCLEAAVGTSCNDTAKKASHEVIPAVIQGMLKTKKGPEDLEPRMACQAGARKAMLVYMELAHFGASHGIGHQLGTYGVGHGHTSCVLLPAVMKYNKSVNGSAQEEVMKVISGLEEIQAILKRQGKDEKDLDLGDLLDIVIRELGMPRRLSEAGFAGAEENVREVAERAVRDWACQSNPIPMTDPAEVIKILKQIE